MCLLCPRFETMAITLAVHVLGCTGTCEERAALIHKLILIAAELKSSLGNMFGFAAVMRALQLPQVSLYQIKVPEGLILTKTHLWHNIMYTFLSFVGFGRCPVWSRPGPRYGSVTQRALFCSRKL